MTHVWTRGMVRVDAAGTTALITFDRAEKLNAMDRAFWLDIREALEWIGSDGSFRVIVFTGAGDKAFSVGGDIASFVALQTAEARRDFQVDAMTTFEAVAECPVPTIAAVNGFALGGGCEIAMACDMILASRDAVFGMPEARFGLVPGYGVLRAPALIGSQMSKLMIFAGERLSSDEALRCGLAQKLFDPDALMEESLRIAAAIGEASPQAIAAGKALMQLPTAADAIAKSVDVISELHGTPASRDAVARFLTS